MPAAARVGDQVLQDAPHCHAPIHPPGSPAPAPLPHPALPLAIVSGVATVLFANQPAATLSSQTAPCVLPTCIPSGPGFVSAGSGAVMIGGQPAARVGDMTLHSSCAAPIPGLTGKILPPGAPTVIIGG